MLNRILFSALATAWAATASPALARDPGAPSGRPAEGQSAHVAERGPSDVANTCPCGMDMCRHGKASAPSESGKRRTFDQEELEHGNSGGRG